MNSIATLIIMVSQGEIEEAMRSSLRTVWMLTGQDAANFVSEVQAFLRDQGACAGVGGKDALKKEDEPNQAVQDAVKPCLAPCIPAASATPVVAGSAVTVQAAEPEEVESPSGLNEPMVASSEDIASLKKEVCHGTSG